MDVLPLIPRVVSLKICKKTLPWEFWELFSTCKIQLSTPWVRTCEVERKAKVYMFLRDDQSQQHYSHGQSIEFLWRSKRPDEGLGKWCQGTFLRRCVGSGQQVKIRYEDQQKDCETTVNVKDVRPEESQRKKPAMCLMTRESNHSGRGGLAVAEKLLKAGLRDALGKASTGQGHGNVWWGGEMMIIPYHRIFEGFVIPSIRDGFSNLEG